MRQNPWKHGNSWQTVEGRLWFPSNPESRFLGHQKVILDRALAEIYGVPVERLNQQVNRNRSRFPADFMFQLTPREFAALRLQFATSNKGRGGRRSLPYAFTDHGAIMAATVLNSEQAVEMSVVLRQMFLQFFNLARELFATANIGSLSFD